MQAAAPLTKVVMTSGSASERDGVVYVAQDQGLFRKYGLDVSFVQVRNGPVAMSALSSGETQFHWGSVSGANLGAIAEGADLVFVAGFINRLSGMFMVNPQIKTPAELKGKSVAVNSLSGGGWIFSMLMLDYWGLSPERDKIQFRTLGEQAVMAQGVISGTADAAFLGYTFGKMLQGKGFRLLADSEKLPIPYQGSGVMAKRSFIMRRRRHWKTCSELCSIARHLSAIRKIRRKYQERSPERCASNGSKTPRTVIKAWSIFTSEKFTRASRAFAT